MSHVVIAPFSNSDIRDWPPTHFRDLIGLLLQRLPDDAHINVIGTATQKLRACEIVRPHPSMRVTNDCGRHAWSDVLDRLRTADLIIGNNSGIGHIGGYFDRPTVCIFGGSHQRREWRPLGRSMVIISRVIGCSPCHLDHRTQSPYAKACLRDITPSEVADAAISAMRRFADRDTSVGRSAL